MTALCPASRVAEAAQWPHQHCMPCAPPLPPRALQEQGRGRTALSDKRQASPESVHPCVLPKQHNMTGKPHTRILVASHYHQQRILAADIPAQQQQAGSAASAPATSRMAATWGSSAPPCLSSSDTSRATAFAASITMSSLTRVQRDIITPRASPAVAARSPSGEQVAGQGGSEIATRRSNELAASAGWQSKASVGQVRIGRGRQPQHGHPARCTALQAAGLQKALHLGPPTVPSHPQRL